MALETIQHPTEEKEPEALAEGSGEEPEETEEAETRNIGNLLSPEAAVMIPLAVIIDIVSFIPVINIASDIIGMIIIGPWMFFRSGAMPEKPQRPGKPTTATKNAGQKILRRFGLTAILELIPIVSMIPWWTITVYNELKG